MSDPYRAPVRSARLALITFTLVVSGSTFAQQGPVLKGVLATPPGATGNVSAYAIYLSGARFKSLAQGTLEAGGAFTITLPTAVPDSRLNPVEMATLCATGTANVSANPPGVLHAMTMFVMWLGEETGAGALIASSDDVFDLLADQSGLRPGDFAVYHLYAAGPFRLTGTCVVPEGFPVEFAIDAPAGWSLVKYGHAGDDLGTVLVESIASLPQEAQWRTFTQ